MKRIFQAGTLLKLYVAFNIINMPLFWSAYPLIGLLSDGGFLLRLVIFIYLANAIVIGSVLLMPESKIALIFGTPRWQWVIFLAETIFLAAAIMLFFISERSEVQYGTGQWELGVSLHQTKPIATARNEAVADFLTWNFCYAALSSVLILISIGKQKFSTGLRK